MDWNKSVGIAPLNDDDGHHCASWRDKCARGESRLVRCRDQNFGFGLVTSRKREQSTILERAPANPRSSGSLSVAEVASSHMLPPKVDACARDMCVSRHECVSKPAQARADAIHASVNTCAWST